MFWLDCVELLASDGRKATWILLHLLPWQRLALLHGNYLLVFDVWVLHEVIVVDVEVITSRC